MPAAAGPPLRQDANRDLIRAAMQHESTPLTLLSRPASLFDETLRLLEEARDYLQANRERRLSIIAACNYAVEATRLTARLTEMMAWLLARRAVANGEISEEIGRTAFRLQWQGVCAVDRSEAMPSALDDLVPLLQRSLRLYQRIARLDSSLGEPEPSLVNGGGAGDGVEAVDAEDPVLDRREPPDP